MALEKVTQNRVSYDNSNEDRLIAVSETIWHVNEAMDELRGLGEYEQWFDILSDMYDEMEKEIDELEAYASGEQMAELAEMRREYERDLLWDSQYDG